MQKASQINTIQFRTTILKASHLNENRVKRSTIVQMIFSKLPFLLQCKSKYQLSKKLTLYKCKNVIISQMKMNSNQMRCLQLNFEKMLNFHIITPVIDL